MNHELLNLVREQLVKYDGVDDDLYAEWKWIYWILESWLQAQEREADE